MFSFNHDYLSKRQLRRRGFVSVGEDVRVNSSVRLYLFNSLIGDESRIDNFAIITGCVKLGKKIHISPYVFISATGGTTTLEDYSGVGSHSSLFTKSDSYEIIENLDQPTKQVGPILIGARSVLGRNVTVLPGSVVGSNCTIGAGCVVQGQVPNESGLISSGIRVVQRQRHHAFDGVNADGIGRIRELLLRLAPSESHSLSSQIDSLATLDLLEYFEQHLPRRLDDGEIRLMFDLNPSDAIGFLERMFS